MFDDVDLGLEGIRFSRVCTLDSNDLMRKHISICTLASKSIDPQSVSLWFGIGIGGDLGRSCVGARRTGMVTLGS